MITSKDSEFHPVAKDNWRWTETTPLSFSVPQAGILGNMYIATRPNLGVALSSVGIVKGFRFQPYQVDFSDAQMHLPCPDNYTNYELASGIRVHVTQPPMQARFRSPTPRSTQQSVPRCSNTFPTWRRSLPKRRAC